MMCQSEEHTCVWHMIRKEQLALSFCLVRMFMEQMLFYEF